MAKIRFTKSGKRLLEAKGDKFMAVIFGCNPPRQFWAWGVWGSKFCREGISFSQSAARMNVAKAVAEL